MTHVFRRFPIIAVLAVLLALPAFAQEAPDLESAYWTAWWSNDIVGAEEQLDAIAAETPESAFLLQRRGLHALIYRNDPAGAIGFLERASAANRTDNDTAVLLARAYLATGRAADTIAVLTPVFEADAYNMDAARWLGEAQLASGHREDAITVLQRARAHVATSLHINRLLHRLLIEDGNYAGGYAIWHDENLFALDGAEAEIAQPLNARYAALAANPAAFSRVERAHLFWDLRMMDEVIFELSQDTNDTDASLLHRTHALVTFTRDLSSALDAYHADRIWSADVEPRFGAYIWPVFAALDEEIDELSFEIMDDKRAQGAAAIDAVEDYFPIEMTCGNTGGFLNCHGGYEVYRTTHHLNQWGETMDVESQVLKWMFTNGLQAWAWDFAAQTGGWTVSEGDTSTFVNVIDPKFGAATSRVRNFLHGDPVDVVALRHEALAALDGEARYSEALEDLFLQHHFTLIAERGEANQEAVMIASYFDFSYTTTTVLHEGQHFIDGHSGTAFENWELEFRAKLTEIAYGGAPFLTLHALYGPSLNEPGQTQPHPRANAEIFRRILQVLETDDRYAHVRENGLIGLLDLSEGNLRAIAETIWVETYGPF